MSKVLDSLYISKGFGMGKDLSISRSILDHHLFRQQAMAIGSLSARLPFAMARVFHYYVESGIR